MELKGKTEIPLGSPLARSSLLPARRRYLIGGRSERRCSWLARKLPAPNEIVCPIGRVSEENGHGVTRRAAREASF